MNQKDRVFINIASEIATLSKCVSHNVGCIIVKDDRIISMGYNGTPSGFINCCDKFPNYNKKKREVHHLWSNKFEIHAEENAMLYAAKTGMCIDGAKMYCTLQPCNHCLKNITQSGIVEIIYKDLYDKFNNDSELNSLLKTNGLKIRQFLV